MKTRIITAVFAIAVLAVVLALYQTVVMDIAVALLCLIALWEIFHALQFEKGDYFLLAAGVFYTFAAMFCFAFGRAGLVPVASYAVVVILCIYTVLRGGKTTFRAVSTLVVFYGLVVLAFGSWIYLKYKLPAETYQYESIFFTVLAMCIAWGGDSCAYFAGSFFGRHKLCPSISPHKTVEGAIGGVLGSALFSVLATLIYTGLFERAEAARTGGMLYLIVALAGAAASILGIFGDLLASIIKREVGIKDYGKLFPGHGGVMDRFDSLLFIAPLVAVIGLYIAG